MINVEAKHIFAPKDDDLSFGSMLEKARAFALNFAERADETDRIRRVPDASIKELRDAGFMRVRQPKRWGGLERTSLELFELAYTVAQGCASTGWVYGVVAGHASLIAEFPIEAQEEVWGANPDALASSAYAPTGRTQPAPGGVLLSGRFPFSSGCDHAQWAILGALITDAERGPLPHLLLVPKSELSIIDDWHTLGLCGTGSKTLVAEEVFVPAHRVMEIAPVWGGLGPLGLQSALVGAAVGAVDAFIQEIKDKPGRMGGPPPSQSDHYRILIGQSWGSLSAAWKLLADAVRVTEEVDVVPGMTRIPRDLATSNCAVAAVISRLTLSAIEGVFELSGGHGIYNSRLSRALRDVRAGTQHVAVNSHMAAKEAGALLLSPG